MKKAYATPKLVLHGTIEEMTKAFGSSSSVDTIFIGQSIYGYHTGSQDGVVVPQ